MVEVLWQMTDVDHGGRSRFPRARRPSAGPVTASSIVGTPTREVAPADNENTRPPAEVNGIEVWRRDGTGCRTA